VVCTTAAACAAKARAKAAAMEINMQKADFHGEWNYTILPST
jgi:hypothetical protein